jgi:hypothetical protein
VPSPKFHERDVMLFCASVEVSVKVAVRPLVVKVKFAVGAVLVLAVRVVADEADAAMKVE